MEGFGKIFFEILGQIQKDPYSKFNYKAVKQSDSTVVLCAGPSVANNKDKVLDYIKNNNSVVLGSNYSYESIGIKSDYTYVANDFKLSENAAKINNHIIVPFKVFNGNEVDPRITRKLLLNHIKKGFKVYVIGAYKTPTTYTITKGTIKIEKDGEIIYSRLSSAGHGCMYLSTVFQPKKILLVGMDGPADSSCQTKVMFDGKVVKYGKPKKNENFKQHFVNVVMPTLKSKGITLETFVDVGIYQINKEEVGIRVI
jgi:hypothetical protein